MKIPRIVIWIAGILMIGILLTTFAVAKAEQDVLNTFAGRLENAGVAYSEINVASRFPLDVEVVLQGDAGWREEIDLFQTKRLITREAVFSSMYGMSINSVQVRLIDQDKNTLDWEQIFLTKNMIAQLTAVNEQPVLDIDTSLAMIRDEIDTGYLKVNQAADIKVEGTAETGYELTLVLTAESIEQANQSLPALMGSVAKVVKDVNDQGGNVSVYSILIQGPDGVSLLNYTNDVTLAWESWGMEPDLNSEWFPRPLDAGETTPMPPTAYPLPESQPTPVQVPYP